MSESVRPERETAYRLFAAEFDDASLSYAESDEERAPNYVVTPTGARVNRLFLVGVLTEIEAVNDTQLRARIVDPTGAFVVYAGQYQPEALSFLESASAPAFVAVTGKARTFEPEDSDRVFTSVRPETLSEVDAETRDRFVVDTAERTTGRVAAMRGALSRAERDDDLRAALEADGVEVGLAAGVPRAIAHYGTTTDYLDAVEGMALDAARVVAGEREEVDPLTVAPGTGESEGSTDRTAPPEADETASADEDASAEPSTAVATEADPESAVEATDEDAIDEGEPAAEPARESEQADDPASPVEAEPEEEFVTEPESTAEADGPGSPSVEEPEDLAHETSEASTPEEDVAAAPSEPIESEANEPVEPEASEAEPDPSEEGTVDADMENPEEFELDDEVREQVEAEYGTEFESAATVGAPGEAEIETPTPDEADAADDEDRDDTEDDVATEPAAADGPEAEPTVDSGTEAPAEPAADEPDETTDEADTPDAGDDTEDETEVADADPEEAVVAVMQELDDGSGADREAVVDRVVEEYGLTPADADDGIQSALMSGECYEPDDDTLKPI